MKKPTLKERLAKAEAQVASMELDARMFRAYVRDHGGDHPPKGAWFPVIRIYQNYVAHVDRDGLVDQTISVNHAKDVEGVRIFLRYVTWDPHLSEETRSEAEAELASLERAVAAALAGYGVAT